MGTWPDKNPKPTGNIHWPCATPPSPLASVAAISSRARRDGKCKILAASRSRQTDTFQIYVLTNRSPSARLPKKLSLLLNSKQLQKIHHVTLGFENSFLVTWRDIQGGDHIGTATPFPSIRKEEKNGLDKTTRKRWK